MLITGILNPQLNSLLSRVRHTNMLVIADRGFPFWPQIETVDLSLVDDIPRVLEVLGAIRLNFRIGRFYMADEFRLHNTAPVVQQWLQAMAGADVVFGPHTQLKLRVPHAVGLIRTADTVQYASIILESA